MASITTLLYSDTEIDCLNTGRFTAFTCPGNSPDSVIRYRRIQLSTSPSPALSPEEAGIIKNAFSFPDKRYTLPFWESPLLPVQEVKDRLLKGAPDKDSTVLDVRSDSVSIFNFSNHHITYYYLSCFEESLRRGRIAPYVFSLFLHDLSALILHCSCVNFQGRAAVFFAMDEGGKTTAASLCTSGVIMADDQILFRKQDENLWLAYGTPWTTFQPNVGSAVPKAFFLLEKADEFSLTKLGSRELLSFLWNEHNTARFLLPPRLLTALFDLYMSLSSSAPVYLMKFSKEYVDQEAVVKCFGKNGKNQR